MFRKYTAIVLTGIIFVSLLTGCMLEKEETVPKIDGERISSAVFEENVSEGEVVTPSESETESEAESELVSEIEISTESTGITPHDESEIFLENGNPEPGPTITVVDGITYVNGILIANKTYSLPADYDPGDLLDEVYDAFYELQAGARSDGLSIYISSGYRDYDLQSRLYKNYCARDGQAAADRYSARPGHSEHQTGLAMDVNEISDRFIGTPEAIWLSEHAHEYGFIIRYMQDKEEITGYKYEPWHLRYLGVDLATDVFESGLCLEEYLGIDSVYQE